MEAKAKDTTIIKAIGNELIVQFYYGTLIKELDGSQVFFSYLDSHDTDSNVEKYKKEILANIQGIKEEDIEIWDANKKEKVTEG